MRRKLSLLLVSLLLSLPLGGFAQAAVRGDADGSGVVDIDDVNTVINVMLHKNQDPSLETQADVDGDGAVDVDDLNIIINVMLGKDVVQPVVHVYGDGTAVEGRVVQVTDGTVTLACDAAHAPQPGEVIVCGVATNAPVGFLRQVVSVQGTGGQYVVTTTDASLEEALPDGDYDLPVPMQQEGSYVMVQAPGQRPRRVQFSTTLKLGVKISLSGFELITDVSDADEADVLEGKEDKRYPVKIIAQLTPSVDFNFICSRHNSRIERIGLRGGADITADIMGKLSKEGNLKLLGDDGVKLFSIHLKPITVMAGYVPIVFTPRIDVFLNVDLNGEVYIKSKFVAAKASGEFSYVYTRTPDPNTGSNHSFTTAFDCSAVGDGQLGERMKELFAPKVGVNGSITTTLKPTLDVSLYGANDIFNVGVPISPWVKAEGNLALKLEKDIELDFDDQIIISGGVDIGLSARFKLGRKNLKWEKDVTLLETQLLEPIGITPRFENFKVNPGNPIPPDTKQVRFSADMTKPNIQLLPEEDYGFAYGLPGENRRDSWTFVSQKGYYDSDFTPTHRTQYIETYVEASKLDKDKTYRACPYVTVFGINIYKKGADFSFKKKEDDGDWVDLGLPSGTLWATRNIGADKPEDYGDYFAWGETTPKVVYIYDTYKWWKEYRDANGHCHEGYTKYCWNPSFGLDGFVDGKTELDLADDAAAANWGGGARMPSWDQITELQYKCTWQETKRNGVNGHLVTGPNGNTIFLPAEAGMVGYWPGGKGYWSRMLISQYVDRAYCMGFTFSYLMRERGGVVRAVRVP